jgi:hypothetical protein
LLVDPARSRFHAYFDTNQSLYGAVAKELVGFSMVPIHLGRNLRNTKAIHGAASRFYQGLPVTADGPDGLSVEWIECDEAQVYAKVSESVTRLTTREAVLPSDVAVLAPDERSVAILHQTLRQAMTRGLFVDTIARFKGRERRLVVVAATGEMADERELAYVGLSRARAHLLVIGSPLTLAWLRGVTGPQLSLGH